MRRATIVTASTVVGLAAVLGYRPHSASQVSLAAASTSASSTDTPSTDTAAPATDTSTSSTDTSSSGSGGGTSQAPAQPATPAPSSAPATRTATGQDVAINEGGRQYGDIQAKVTMRGSKITNVSITKLNVYDGRSGEIENYSVPQLMQQTIDAQSAQIDGVSGATYTSMAYEQSVQSAIDHINAGGQSA